MDENVGLPTFLRVTFKPISLMRIYQILLVRFFFHNRTTFSCRSWWQRVKVSRARAHPDGQPRQPGQDDDQAQGAQHRSE